MAKERVEGQRERAEEKEEDEAEECKPSNEEVLINVVKDPGLPTSQERERHNMTHNPYRSWSPVCVEARGKEDPHKKKKTQETRR